MPNITREVNFNDGEGCEYTDFNNVQRYLRAHLQDLVLGPMMRQFQKDVVPATNSLFAVGRSMSPQTNGAGTKVSFLPGTVFQNLGGTIDGTDPQVLAYYHDGTEWSVGFTGSGAVLTLAAASGVNPRIDLIQIQLAPTTTAVAAVSRDFKDAVTGALTSTLERKVRNVVATVQIKTGTPGAIPAEPTPDAGFVRLAAIVVKTSATTVSDTGTVADYRVPLGFRSWMQPGSYGVQLQQNVADWTIGVTGQALATAASKVLYFPCPVAPGRVLRITVRGNLTGIAVSSLGYLSNAHPLLFNSMDTGAGITLPWTQNSASNGGGSMTRPNGAVLQYDFVQGGLQMPLWSNGFRTPGATDNPNAPSFTSQLYFTLTSGANTDYIDYVEWEIAPC